MCVGCFIISLRWSEILESVSSVCVCVCVCVCLSHFYVARHCSKSTQWIFIKFCMMISYVSGVMPVILDFFNFYIMAPWQPIFVFYGHMLQSCFMDSDETWFSDYACIQNPILMISLWILKIFHNDPLAGNIVAHAQSLGWKLFHEIWWNSTWWLGMC